MYYFTLFHLKYIRMFCSIAGLIDYRFETHNVNSRLGMENMKENSE